MDKTHLSDKTLDLLREGRKTANNWTVQTGEVMGGFPYAELSSIFGPNGIQVAIMGGQITITPENDAWAFLEELHGAKTPTRAKTYEVVLWEQRRIAIRVEAENAEQAEHEALAIWDVSTEEDMETIETFTVVGEDEDA